MRLLACGAFEMYRNDRLVARIGTNEIEEDVEDETGFACRGQKLRSPLCDLRLRRSGRRSDRRESPSLKPDENPAANRVG